GPGWAPYSRYVADPFETSLTRREPEAGAFRTAEPTPEAKLERARRESFERVRRATAEAIAEEERRRGAWDWVPRVALAVSVVGLAGALARWSMGDPEAGAWVCLAATSVVASALGWFYRRRTRARRPPGR
ncbi:MAG TPA: hypothetical protein RMH99_12030, partial [Sandaracinaceae bacterium LLY-WYZ-13_1]|nr:hypothetical protein [Sandaracinaceae bacterium LLY-WYZ-13_1]